ncbi:MAG: hypothetical protein IMW94_01585 [Thermoanaerobacter sp.]|jgi:hypothetical protein|nr:hypothetical protein [Thermoanaerobacter sp.]
MAKAAKAKSQTIEVKASVTPETKLAKITVNGIEHLVPAERLELEKLIKDGCELTTRIAALTEKLKEIKDRILPYLKEAAGAKKSARITGIAGLAELTIRQEIKIADHRALQAYFGERFEDYVDAEVIFKPTRALRNLAVDADHPDRDTIRAALKIAESESVRFVPKEG